MIDTTLPAFVLSSVPGLNFLAIESVLLQKCKGLGNWPKRLKYLKWSLVGLLVMMYALSDPDVPFFAPHARKATFIELVLIVLVIACIFAFGMSLAALTNSNYC